MAAAAAPAAAAAELPIPHTHSHTALPISIPTNAMASLAHSQTTARLGLATFLICSFSFLGFFLWLRS